MEYRPLMTTLVGSLPKPSWLGKEAGTYSTFQDLGAALEEAQDDATIVAIREQELTGLDIVSDGEQRREHYIRHVIRRFSGFDFDHLSEKQTRGGRYTVQVPRITGPVARTEPVLARDFAVLRKYATRAVKITLPGPLTIIDTSHDDFYGDKRALAFDLAAALNAEARELAAAGCDLIQIDEPTFNIYLDDVAAFGIEALDRVVAGVDAETAVHICYGYGAPTVLRWKRQNQDWGQYRQTLPWLATSQVDQLALEFAAPNLDPAVLELTGEKRVAMGVVDVSVDTLDTPEMVADRLRRALEYISPDRLLASTDCGLVPVERTRAYAKLRALVEGTKLVRRELGLE
ncbi:MAG TPA: methionine synthase [Dehalococcoidia bacterium]|nr:methionine synthase [Dehalococcoidia bacterium]